MSPPLQNPAFPSRHNPRRGTVARALARAAVPVVAALLALAAAGPVAAQQGPGTPLIGPDNGPAIPRFGADDSFANSFEMRARRARALNIMRQKSLVSDTEKLLRLAQELNAADASGRSPLSSPERMRRLAEIEKLAKSVRSKMSFAAGSGLDLEQPTTLWTH